MTQIFGLTTLFIWLGEVLLIIAFVAAVCFYYLRCRNRNRVEAAAAADRRQQAAAPRAQPAAAVQMAPMALVLRLDRVSVTYTRRNGGGGSDDRRQQPSSVAEAQQDCAICLSPFEYGDRCSVMHVCRHEFHRSCIAKWLVACHNHNTCPLCRAQLRWDDVAINMP